MSCLKCESGSSRFQPGEGPSRGDYESSDGGFLKHYSTPSLIDAVMQFKPKRKLMTKFFNEPVDALDLRLANAEENLSRLPVDPFTDTVKQEVSLTIHNIPCYAFRYLVFLKVYLNIHNFPCFAFIYLVFLKVFKHTEVLSNPHVCLFSLFYRFSEN